MQDKVIIKAPMSIVWKLLLIPLDWLQVPTNAAIKALRSDFVTYRAIALIKVNYGKNTAIALDQLQMKDILLLSSLPLPLKRVN